MSLRKLFRDRRDAGQRLASHLGAYRPASPLVLGLPRGGVPVAYEVARVLEAPLDVCVVRKLGAPMQPELGLGAVGEDGVVYVDRDTTDRLGVTEEELDEILRAERAAIDAQVSRFREGAPPLDVRGKTVIVVDDGVATGGTARAALETLRARPGRSCSRFRSARPGARRARGRRGRGRLPPPGDVHAVSPWYGTSRRPPTKT